MKKKIVILAAFLILILSINFSCQSKAAKIVAEGEKLAAIHCASCHALPSPSLLDKKTWNQHVLPQMAELMFVDSYYNPFNASGPLGDMPSSRVAPENLFPYEKWEKIVKYYLATAPQKPLERKETLSPVHTGLNYFLTRFLYDKIKHPVTTLVYFDTTGKKIFFGDGNAEKIFMTDASFNSTDSMQVGVGVTDIHLNKNEAAVITMGILKPSDARLGRLELIVKGKKNTILIDSLQRPVQASYADLNGDDKTDIIICEFGFRQGCLAWFENKGRNKYKKHLLKNLPGATRTEVYDFNKDGRPDIAALMAQGDEGVFIYYNEGNGKFREDRVLQFPPSYGSNYFQLFDFNGDGFKDIITTNGDNGDYSIILKPYHGIRIFYNNGSNRFEENKFLPVYGAQKAIPADYDNDGDIDIASISFFPDYEKHPEESFIYWENSGDNNYKRYTFDGFANGRWITMDAADFDMDGDTDILLGNAFFSLGNVPQSVKDKWEKRPLSIVVLENTTIKKQ